LSRGSPKKSNSVEYVLPSRKRMWSGSTARIAVRLARGHRAVQVTEAVLDDLERLEVGLEVAVVDRYPDAVQAEVGEERRVLLRVER
jgi:hypothetical protein